jgi:acetyl esterase/lipase
VNLERGKTVGGVPVPLDAELQVAYDAYMAEEPDLAPMSLALLPGIRAEVEAEVAGLGDLSRGGQFTVSQPSVPGLDGAPEVPLLVCTPVGAAASRPVLYYLHGGGFFLQRSPDRAWSAARRGRAVRGHAGVGRLPARA